MSGDRILPGDRICRYTPEQHSGSINILADTSSLPYDVCELIMDKYRKPFIGRWCKEDSINVMNAKTTSGRTIKQVVDETKRTFVKGSGFVGCDTYDRHFDAESYNEESDAAYEARVEAPETAEDAAFINDDEEECGEFTEDEEEDWDEDDEDDQDDEWVPSDDELE
jgi:hypothetical protein